MNNIIKCTRRKPENHSTTCQKMYFLGPEFPRKDKILISDIRPENNVFSRPNPLVENKQMRRTHIKGVLRMIDTLFRRYIWKLEKAHYVQIL